MGDIHGKLTHLGFRPPVELGTLRSINHLFRSRDSRTGIYALVLPNGCVYIGQAMDVVRRFSDHRRRLGVIEAFSFFAAAAGELDAQERAAIFRAERAGLTLTNVLHVTDVVGDTDLDAVVVREEQARWEEDPLGQNNAERVTTAPLQLPRQQVERFARNHARLLAHENGGTAARLLAMYLAGSVPLPRATEYSFWSVSCMPSTNQRPFQRLLCVNAGMMELFVLGSYTEPAAQGRLWGFVIVASDELLRGFGGLWRFKLAHPGVSLQSSDYRDGGQHQFRLYCEGARQMTALLRDERVRRAAGALTLRVMRKRATIFRKYHCKQLADQAYDLQEDGDFLAVRRPSWWVRMRRPEAKLASEKLRAAAMADRASPERPAG